MLRTVTRPSAPNALVLVTAEEARKMCPNVPCVAVDPNIARKDAKAPKEGVRWMFRTLYGFENDYNDNSKDSSRSIGSNSATNSTIENSGVLLADDMGLGKTLQVLACSAWTVLKQTPFPTLKKPFKRILVACPASLVGN